MKKAKGRISLVVSPTPGKATSKNWLFAVFEKLTNREMMRVIFMRGRRKAMIVTGTALNTNGQLEVEQLSPDLRCIVLKHPSILDSARGAIMSQA